MTVRRAALGPGHLSLEKHQLRLRVVALPMGLYPVSTMALGVLTGNADHFSRHSQGTEGFGVGVQMGDCPGFPCAVSSLRSAGRD